MEFTKFVVITGSVLYRNIIAVGEKLKVNCYLQFAGPHAGIRLVRDPADLHSLSYALNLILLIWCFLFFLLWVSGFGHAKRRPLVRSKSSVDINDLVPVTPNKVGSTTGSMTPGDRDTKQDTGKVEQETETETAMPVVSPPKTRSGRKRAGSGSTTASKRSRKSRKGKKKKKDEVEEVEEVENEGDAGDDGTGVNASTSTTTTTTSISTSGGNDNRSGQPASGDRSSIVCVNPGTGEYLGDIDVMAPQEVRERVNKARQAQHTWEQTTFEDRKVVLQAFMDYIVDHQMDICKATSQDTGKTILEAEFGEILTTCEKIRHLMKHGEKSLQREYRQTGLLMTKTAYVEYQALGVFGVIVPWNYPFQHLFGQLIPPLFAGNAVMVKVSEHVSWSAVYFENIIKKVLTECGQSPDLVQVVVGFGETGAALVNGGVDKVLFIGSTGNGKRVMETAAKTLTPVILELGGKDPMIICEDADFEAAISLVMRGVFTNAGQNCIASERVYVHEDIYDRFVEEIVEKARNLRQDVSTELPEGQVCDIGGMTMPQQLNIIQELVDDAVANGATLHCGGAASTARGFFYEPTVLSNVSQDMRIVQEEVFGPVVLICRWSDDQEVVEKANGVAFGLGASVCSSNYNRAHRIAEALQCGMCVINDFGVNYLMQDLPFGGVKYSGFGRFCGPEGLRECTNPKVIVTDRFPMITRAPKALEYPVSANAWNYVADVVTILYGNGLWKKLRGVVAFVKHLFG